MSKKPHFRKPFESQHATKSETTDEICATAFLSYVLNILREVDLENDSLIDSETLGLCVNTFIADDKYSLRYYQKLQQPIQMGLSKIQRTSSQVFAQFLKFILNFEHFEKKDEISEVRSCQRRG